MDVNVLQLIYHNYSNEEIVNSCTPNYLKEEGFEWNMEENKTNMFADVIQRSDIVVSYSNIDNGEKYAYVFIKTEHKRDNTLFIITDVILDEKLGENSIRLFVTNTLKQLYRKDLKYQDYIRAINQHPFYYIHGEDSTLKVCNEIISLWKLETGGLNGVPFFTDMPHK